MIIYKKKKTFSIKEKTTKVIKERWKKWNYEKE